MRTAIGLDMGTTRIKASLVGETREELALASELTPWVMAAGQLQFDLNLVGDIALRLAAQVAERGRASGHEILGLAVTGMGETGALLDAGGKVLAPGYAWHHSLGDPTRLTRHFGADEYMIHTGREPNSVPSLAKLDYLRVQGHRFAPGQTWLNVPDYVAFRLTGVRAAEISLASRSALLDIPTGKWWEDAFEFLGAGTWLVPEQTAASGSALGAANGEIPEVLKGITVATGGHDHPMAALAFGGAQIGTLNVSLGTAEAQVRIEASVDDAQRLALVRAGAGVDWHPFADRFTVLRPLSTGMTMERLSMLLGADTRESRRELSLAALEAEPSRIRLLDVGNDGFGIADISDKVTRAGAWRAAAEQLVADSAAVTREMNAILGEPKRINTFGGWLFDPLVAHLRRALGQVASAGEPAEPGAFGAALMAFKACGLELS
ncbi:MAG: hypothetical protein LBR21_00195 [Propionibacteriaceae bacterium]|jgi:sugar (pentulose or hexulose) kinase|nr:hypothetical protein [Propionibacteriaceae bacterium]